jgi:hypothetical protein
MLYFASRIVDTSPNERNSMMNRIEITKGIVLEEFTRDYANDSERNIWGTEFDAYSEVPNFGKFIFDGGGTGGGSPEPLTIILSGNKRFPACPVKVTILTSPDWDVDDENCDDERRAVGYFKDTKSAIEFIKISFGWR